MKLFGLISKSKFFDIRDKVSVTDDKLRNCGYRVYVIGMSGYFTAYANMHFIEMSEKELVLKRWDYNFKHDLHYITHIGVYSEYEKNDWLNYSLEKAHTYYAYNGKIQDVMEESHITPPPGKCLVANYQESTFKQKKIRATSAMVRLGIITLYGVDGGYSSQLWSLFKHSTTISLERK